jgi:hypothetical protein
VTMIIANELGVICGWTRLVRLLEESSLGGISVEPVSRLEFD